MRNNNLTDFLGDDDDYFDDWADVHEAPDFGVPVAKGVYDCVLANHVLDTAKTGTKFLRLDFRIEEGEFAGRFLFKPVYFTKNNRNNAKRDLGRLGVQNPKADLARLSELHGRMHLKVDTTVRTGDDGEERNEVRSFTVVRVDPLPPPEPFAPTDGPPPETPRTGRQLDLADGLFPYGGNAGPYAEGA